MDNSYTLILILYLQLYSVLCRKVGDKPNIIIVIADDLGYNDVGYHGSEIYTPNIDRLAYGGVRLENYYVQPRCSPSRAELLTGRLAAHTGFYGMSQLERGGLSLTEKLLPEAMTQLGYTSHHIGKWHIGYYNESYLPTSRGYHSFFGFHTGRMDYYTKQKCDKLTKRGASARLCGYDLWQNDHVYVGNDSHMYSTQLFTKRAVETILKHPISKPLFMTLAYQGVHSPLQIPSEYERLHPEILSRDRRIYAGMVSCLDEGLGNLTDALKSTGLWNNTVLIFTTDNGASTKFGGSNWPLRGEKNSLFEGGIRAVGFVNSPLLTRQGKISHKLIHITDWYPTSVWLAGGANSRNQDGFNIWNAINERSSGVRRELLLHMNVRRKSLGSSKQDSTGFTAALRQGDWKLIIGNPGEGSWTAPPGYGLRSIIVPSNYTQSFWLFNVHTDPEERYNMANVYPQLTKRLWQRVQEYYSTAEPNPYSSETMMADPSRHGGVWGPWDWKSPTKDDQHCIGICNNYAINNRDKPDKQFNNDLESGWDKVTNWLVHYSRHLYVLF